jgi:amidase
MIRAGVLAVFANNKLDAIIYPTGKPAALINPPKQDRTSGNSAGGVEGPLSKSPDFIANIAGFPDLVVPAGMTKDGLPVTLSFFGTAYSDGKLLGYGYDFEQATHARVLPKNTPPLPSDHLKY